MKKKQKWIVTGLVVVGGVALTAWLLDMKKKSQQAGTGLLPKSYYDARPELLSPYAKAALSTYSCGRR